LKHKGRSRGWIDNHGSWLINIEFFKPSYLLCVSHEVPGPCAEQRRSVQTLAGRMTSWVPFRSGACRRRRVSSWTQSFRTLTKS
jgi:hypothetical protein